VSRAGLEGGRGTTLLLTFMVVFLAAMLGLWLTHGGLLTGILP
jgi:hypothetical protein